MPAPVTVFAPASVGNFACGFDVIGVAIDHPGDVVTIHKNKTGRLVIREITGDSGKLSYDISKNTVTVAISAMMKAYGIKEGFDIILHKNMPLGSGLGSSAASAAAGVYALNLINRMKLKKEELVRFAMAGEAVASGSAHADNVAPSLLGGIVLIRSYDPLEVISLDVPDRLHMIVVHPHIQVLTREARAVLHKNIPLKSAIQQWANTAALVAGLAHNDYSLIGRSVTDVVAEPRRAPLIPGFYDVKSAALEAGALACSISGAGPSVFAVAEGKKNCSSIGKAMQQVFKKLNIHSDIYISGVNCTGAKNI